MFKKETGHYPSSFDCDRHGVLPNRQYIQRKFGGIVNLRKTLGFDITDFTKGQTRSVVSKMINVRAHQGMNEIYNFLINVFGEASVHREFMVDYNNNYNRCDFYIFIDPEKDKFLIVDCFFSKDRPSMGGSLNTKLKKYRSIQDKKMKSYPIIYLNMNPLLDGKDTDELLKNKKNKLLSNEMLMGIKDFKKYINVVQ